MVAASARPKAAAASTVVLPGSTQRRIRHSWSTPSTSGTATPPSASASQRSPAPRRSKKPSGAWRQVFISAVRAVAEPQPGGGRDVAAGDRRRGHHRRRRAAPRPAGRPAAAGSSAVGSGSLELAAQRGDDRARGALDHRQHLLEAVVATVVRVGHVARPVSTGSKSRNSRDPSVGRAPPTSARLARPSRAPGRSVVEPAGVELPGAVPASASYPAAVSVAAARSVHRVADVPAAGAAAGDLDPVGEAGLGEPRVEHDVRPSASGRCCRGRPARSR